MKQKSLQKEDFWVLRIITEQAKYRLELFPSDTYQKVLDFITDKISLQLTEFEIWTVNGRKLNIDPRRRLKDIVYLSHGSILQVKLVAAKNSALYERASFVSADSKISKHSELSPTKSNCHHPTNARCLKCMAVQKKSNLISKDKRQQYNNGCNHGPHGKCLKCLGRTVKSTINLKLSPEIASQSKVNPQKESPKKGIYVKSKKAVKKEAGGISRITLLKQESVESQLSCILSQQKKDECNHNQKGRCLKCSEVNSNLYGRPSKGYCEHAPEGKCFNCLPKHTQPAHIPFDQYLHIRKANCQHNSQNTCPNCISLKNLRLTVDLKCQKHQPYPQGLCSGCRPENVSIRRQEYRHVDYVQFMSQVQIQNFISYWFTQKQGKEMRFAFLYGYFAQDSHYPNGIRAIVEALYEPHQHTTVNQFWILDSQQRREQVSSIVESLRLQKIGMVIASPSLEDSPFSASQIRVLAKMQQRESVRHSTGYKLSNFFTVLVRPSKEGIASIEPKAFMVSDQGQALQTHNLFTASSNPFKMKISEESAPGELRPAIYLNCKEVSEFQLEYLLVNIGVGIGKDNKFAVLKGNRFPTSSRGTIKSVQIKQYIRVSLAQPNQTRFGDFNLLLLIGEILGLDIACALGRLIADEKKIDADIVSLVDRMLNSLST